MAEVIAFGIYGFAILLIGFLLILDGTGVVRVIQRVAGRDPVKQSRIDKIELFSGGVMVAIGVVMVALTGIGVFA